MANPPLCARCRVPLHPGQTPSALLWGCGRCGGIWLDPKGSQLLTQALNSEALALAESAAQQASTTVDTHPAGLPCPLCSRPLVRRTEPCSRVELDDCPEHGTWFDRGELQQVARALAVARAYGGGANRHGIGRGAGAALLGGAAVGAAAAGAAAVATSAALANPQYTHQKLEQAGLSAGDIAGNVAEVSLEIATEVGAEFAVGAVVEGAGFLAELGFSIIGAIFEGLSS